MADTALPIEKVLHMNGGDGDTSFANNSSIPRRVMIRVKPILEESINKIIYGTNLLTCFKVADLGCSCGPNTLLLASNIIQIVHDASLRLKVGTPTFQIFLNDLFGNDFNSTFKSLPEFYDTLKQDTTCFINATPGTFYGTLFPSNSINFFHSSFSLHWLSQAPDILSEEAKVADDDDDDDGDKGSIYVTSTSPYAEQFKQDFKLFLRSRSKELVPKGGMLLNFMGRFDTPENISVPGLIRMILSDMVSEKLIEEAKSEQFSVPNYFSAAEEVREIIKEEGSFNVERLESIKLSWDGSNLDEEGSKNFKDDNERAEFITRNKRSVFEPILKAHFGGKIMDELFLRFKNKVIQFMPKLEYPILVISLSKVA